MPPDIRPQQDARLTDAFQKESGRLRNFLRRRLADDADVDDLLQDVFCDLIELYRLLKPVEHVSAWLFRVARRRIVDRFRSASRSVEDASGDALESIADAAATGRGEPQSDNPELRHWRSELSAELAAAIADLPDAQREVFVAHAIDGQSFKDLAADTGLSVNALTLRKHHAVQRLRQRLRDFDPASSPLI